MNSLEPASPPTSSFEFFSTSGDPLPGPLEWAPAILAVAVEPEEWEDTQLWRNGNEMPLSLRHLADGVRVAAEWPLSGTGHYQLDLRVGGELRGREVRSIQPRKLTPTAYARLVDDLQEALPVSIAVALQRLGAITGTQELSADKITIAQELVRLRRAVDGTETRRGLKDVLPEISRDPHRILVTEERWVRRDQARRVHPASLVAAVASGHNLDSAGLPLRLPELRVEPSVDVYENRLIKAYVGQVASGLRRVIQVLERREKPQALNEANALLDRLERARRRAPFLEEVGQLARAPGHLTMVLVKRPDYRNAFEGFLEFHRTVSVRLKDPMLDTPLRGLPSLYESWGTLNVIDVVAGLAADQGFEVKRQALLGRDGNGLFIRVLPDGKPALVLFREADGVRVRVIPQRSYSMGSEGLRSISYRQIPDIAIEVELPDDRTDVYLFDPKYKLDSEEGVPVADNARPKKIDIDTMHAYRDAIRDDSDHRVVRFAAILYPGPTTTFGSGLEAISAIPGTATALRSRVQSVIEPALI